VSRAIVERYWSAQDPFDPATLKRLRHPDWSADWPQSGERIPSHDADAAIHQSYPGYPAHRSERLTGSDEVWRALPTPLMFTPVRLSGASDFWIGEARLEYPDLGTWCGVGAIALRDGLVHHETFYFCRASGAVPWPPTYPEKAPAPLPAIGSSLEHDPGAERRHQDAFQAYAAAAASDPEAAALLLFHDDATIDRPQFGQRVVGLAGIARAYGEQRSVLPGRIRRVVASGHVLLGEARLEHAGTAWYLVTILEFRGDRVARATEYIAESSNPPDWRRQWVEPLSGEDHG
jgi:hypothetical protein